MKKIILIILISFIITGCDAIYTVELTDSKINETLEINNYDKSTSTSGEYSKMIDLVSSSNVATDYRNEVPESNNKIDGINYYNIKKITDNNNLGVKYQANFTKEEYEYSTLAFENTPKFNYNFNTKYININTDIINAFSRYKNLNKLTIKLKTNHEVIENNADELKEGTYFWYLDQNNYLDKKINLKLSSTHTINQLNILELDENNYFGSSTLIALYSILGLILLITSVIIFFKVKNSNR
ncbi:MAG: hypothetical protein PHG03_01200 [Bacilli bacterium]|nr:hypothetical protein [Bacilli bacterium]MDD4795162.1 hypothetical protein [Bacilli bacterium]